MLCNFSVVQMMLSLDLVKNSQAHLLVFYLIPWNKTTHFVNSFINSKYLQIADVSNDSI